MYDFLPAAEQVFGPQTSGELCPGELASIMAGLFEDLQTAPRLFPHPAKASYDIGVKILDRAREQTNCPKMRSRILKVQRLLERAYRGPRPGFRFSISTCAAH